MLTKAEIDCFESVGGQTFVRGDVIAIHSGKKMRVLSDRKAGTAEARFARCAFGRIIFSGNLVLIQKKIVEAFRKMFDFFCLKLINRIIFITFVRLMRVERLRYRKSKFILYLYLDALYYEN